MINWQVDPQILAPFVPRGTELDFYHGETFVSLVGFLFKDTRLLGFPVPWHRTFEEVNLRIYVRYKVNDEIRRGVVFIREIVPRTAIATVARLVYNEPYVARKMRHFISNNFSNVSYEWRDKGKWMGFSMQCSPNKTQLAKGSLEEFIAEHYFGYCKQRNGSTIEYRVEHPPWNIHRVEQTYLDPGVISHYPPEFAQTLRGPPKSAFLADGSEVTVLRPETIT